MQGASTLMVLAQLDFAIPSNAVDVVHMLVHAGADPNITNDVSTRGVGPDWLCATA